MKNFQINANLLRAMLSGVEHAHAVKDIRSYINGIRFEVPNEGTLHVIATDGHRLAHAECALSVEREHATPLAFTLAAREVKRLIATLKDSGDQLLELVHLVDDSTLVLNTMTRQIASFELLEESDGRYPDWRRVIPKPETQPQHYAPSSRSDGERFNPLYLADALKGINTAAKIQGTTWPDPRLLLIGGDAKLGHQTALIRYSGNGFEIECVVMGLRG